MEGNELLTLFDPGADEEWTAAEQLALQTRLLPLLARRTALYTAWDSSSVRVETAQELLTSICFTLYEGLAGAPRKALLTADLNEVFERGAYAIEQKSKTCRELWNAACLTAPKLNSRSLRETLRDLGLFWKRYDSRFFAHRFPCDINYPPLQPVPETLSGVEYLGEYLRRLLAENAFLLAFDKDLLVRLLDADCPVWRDAPLNLTAPILSDAVGLALLKKDPRGLLLSDDELAELAALFAGLSDAEAKNALRLAVGRICDAANIRDSFSRTYFADTAAEQLLRLRTVPPEGWRGLFPAPI